MCGVEGYCLRIMQISHLHRFFQETVFVSMHRMPFTIPVEHSCALAPLHSRQLLITSANFIPHYPLSYIPYFLQPNLLPPQPQEPEPHAKYTRKAKVYHPCTCTPSTVIATGSVNPYVL